MEDEAKKEESTAEMVTPNVEIIYVETVDTSPLKSLLNKGSKLSCYGRDIYLSAVDVRQIVERDVKMQLVEDIEDKFSNRKLFKSDDYLLEFSDISNEPSRK